MTDWPSRLLITEHSTFTAALDRHRLRSKTRISQRLSLSAALLLDGSNFHTSCCSNVGCSPHRRGVTPLLRAIGCVRRARLLPKGWMSDACPHTEVPVPIGTSGSRLIHGPTRLPQIGQMTPGCAQPYLLYLRTLRLWPTNKHTDHGTSRCAWKWSVYLALRTAMRANIAECLAMLSVCDSWTTCKFLWIVASC